MTMLEDLARRALTATELDIPFVLTYLERAFIGSLGDLWVEALVGECARTGRTPPTDDVRVRVRVRLIPA